MMKNMMAFGMGWAGGLYLLLFFTIPQGNAMAILWLWLWHGGMGKVVQYVMAGWRRGMNAWGMRVAEGLVEGEGDTAQESER